MAVEKALSMPTDLQGRVSGKKTRQSQAPGEEEVREAPRSKRCRNSTFQDWRAANRKRQHTQTRKDFRQGRLASSREVCRGLGTWGKVI